MTKSSPALSMQFDSLAQQRQANTLGIWIFLASETLFFGGLFLAYSVYRVMHPVAFATASQELNLAAGTINTAILLTSSLSIALAELAATTQRKKATQALLVFTIVLAIAFLGVKSYEYYSEYRNQLVPFLGESFHWPHPDVSGARLFFNLYFVMTGLHAVHLLIGCCLVGATLVLGWRQGQHHARHQSQIRLSALYWHFVDIIWVFIFPLLYLAR